MANTEKEKKQAVKAFKDLKTKALNWIKEQVRIDDDIEELDMKHIAHLMPIEIEGERRDNEDGDMNPEKQKLKNSNKNSKSKILLKPDPDVPGDEYPEPDIIRRKRLNPDPRPPWAGGKLIKVNNFKFLRVGNNSANIYFESEKVGPLALALDSPGLTDANIPIKILKCFEYKFIYPKL
ncbi:MAG: hypothetical protein ACJ0OP_00630 [Thermodesulfobacteriota bacterium]